MRPTLYVPVENQVRELDAKLLFACIAAHRGYPVVFGHKQTLHFAMAGEKPGIYIAKSMRAGSRLMFEIIRGVGHALVAWDEESLVRFDSPEYYDWRFSPHTFSGMQQLFAWGRDDAELFENYAHKGDVSIHVTGNPRVDLLRRELRSFFAAECAEHRAQHGDYILVNTNFSFVNPFVRQSALVLDEKQYGKQRSRTSRGMSLEFAQGLSHHAGQIFEHFKTMIPTLAAAFPDRAIVLRPHPSEDHDLWRELLVDHANVVVRHEGNVVPWLMGAAVLLHNGCTTAVEATLLDRPSVAYRPVHSETYDYALPNALSHNAEDVAGVCRYIGEILDGQRQLIDDERKQALYARHLCATDGALAGERIVDKLDALGYAERRFAPSSALRAATAKLKSQVRETLKRRNMKKADHWASSRYEAHRFPGVTLETLNSSVQRFADYEPAFGQLRVAAHGDALFRIDPNQAN